MSHTLGVAWDESARTGVGPVVQVVGAALLSAGLGGAAAFFDALPIVTAAVGLGIMALSFRWKGAKHAAVGQDPALEAAAVVGLLVVSQAGLHLVADRAQGSLEGGNVVVQGVLAYSAAAMLLLLLRHEHGLTRPFRKPFYLLPLGLLLAFAALSVAWSPVLLTSARRWIGLAVVALMGLIVSTLPLSRQLAVFRVWGWLFLICSFAIISLFPEVGRDSQGQWAGLFAHKNTLGGVAAIALVPFLIRGGMAASGRWGGIALCWAAILGSGSASAMVVGVLLTVLALILQAGRETTRRYARLTLGFAIVVGTLLVFVTRREMLYELVGRTETLTGRTALWDAGWRLAREHQWFGRGYGSLVSEDVARTLVSEARWGAVRLHNGFLDALAELGVIGLSLIVLTLLTGVHLATRIFLKSRGDQTGLWSLLLLAATIMTNVTESRLLGVMPSLGWFLMVVALGSIACRKSHVEGQRRPGRPLVTASWARRDLKGR